MKLSLSTDFCSIPHWRKLVAFASDNGVNRLVYNGDDHRGLELPLIYPRHTEHLLKAHQYAAATRLRECVAEQCRLTRQAGMEYWLSFSVLTLPPGHHVRALLPHLFLPGTEPDMSNPAIYKFIRDQIDEIIDLLPDLNGIELSLMNSSTHVIARLKQQFISREEICRKIIDTVYDRLREKNLGLIQDLHFCDGEPSMLGAVVDAVRRHPQIIVGAPNVSGDFHLQLPFNEHLIRARATNRIQVNFDLAGENWGRNFVPTLCLNQQSEHIELARALGAAWVNGRVSTRRDRNVPHGNILPGKRSAYDTLSIADNGDVAPDDLDVLLSDTLGGINAEFFCKRTFDPYTQPEEVLSEFLVREFGPEADGLIAVLQQVEPLLAKVFYVGLNHFWLHSMLPSRQFSEFVAHDLQLTQPSGTPLPPADGFARPSVADPEGRAAFRGWPVPVGYTTRGPQRLIQEKRRSVDDALRLMRHAGDVAAKLSPIDHLYIMRQFEDLVFFAHASASLLEAMVHYFHLQGPARGVAFPDLDRLRAVVEELSTVADRWKRRYPAGRYRLAEGLQAWILLLEQAIAKESLQDTSAAC